MTTYIKQEKLELQLIYMFDLLGLAN